MKKSIHLICTLAATLLFTGCMGYQLGGSRPEGLETVAMAPVINKSGEPAIELQVTRALRQRIQMDGRVKLVNEPGNADGIIEVKLVQFWLTPIAYNSEEQTTPDMYRLRITGVADLKSTETGEILSSSKTYGEAIFQFQSDLTTSKRNALPAAADEIAKFMLDDLVETWQ